LCRAGTISAVRERPFRTARKPSPRSAGRLDDRVGRHADRRRSHRGLSLDARGERQAFYFGDGFGRIGSPMGMMNPSPFGGGSSVADVFSTGFATPERASPIRGKPGFFRAAKRARPHNRHGQAAGRCGRAQQSTPLVLRLTTAAGSGAARSLSDALPRSPPAASPMRGLGEGCQTAGNSFERIHGLQTWIKEGSGYVSTLKPLKAQNTYRKGSPPSRRLP